MIKKGDLMIVLEIACDWATLTLICSDAGLRADSLGLFPKYEIQNAHAGPPAQGHWCVHLLGLCNISAKMTP